MNEAGSDVVIIGAGVHGASGAYHLAQSGARVTVVERLTPAGGPTGLSSGVCRAYYTNAFLAEAARDSIRMMLDFEGIGQGHDSGYRRTGFLYLHPPQDVEEVIDNAARLNGLDIRVELHTGDDLQRQFPQFVLDDIGIGAYEVEAGYADPAGTTAGMIAGAVAAGAALRSHAAVQGLRLRPGGGAVVLLAGGESLAAERLLIAAGPWTASLASLAQAPFRRPPSRAGSSWRISNETVRWTNPGCGRRGSRRRAARRSRIDGGRTAQFVDRAVRERGLRHGAPVRARA